MLFNNCQAPYEAKIFVQSLSFYRSHLKIKKLEECDSNWYSAMCPKQMFLSSLPLMYIPILLLFEVIFCSVIVQAIPNWSLGVVSGWPGESVLFLDSQLVFRPWPELISLPVLKVFSQSFCVKRAFPVQMFFFWSDLNSISFGNEMRFGKVYENQEFWCKPASYYIRWVIARG